MPPRRDVLGGSGTIARNTARKDQPTTSLVPAEQKGAGRRQPALQPAAHLREGLADTACLRRPAPFALTLPLLDSLIPTGFTVDAPQDILPTVAEGLLAEGMLNEDDWDRELGLNGSLMQGLRRWAMENLPGDCEYPPFKMLPSFEIGVGSQCKAWEVDVEGDIGGFALLTNDSERICTTTVVGSQVEALEAWLPGVGYSLLAKLYHGFGLTVNAATPRWAVAIVTHWWEGADTEEREDHEMNPREFRKQFPKEAIRPKWKAGKMREALAAAEHLPADDWRGRAMRAGWELNRTISRWLREQKAGKCRGDDVNYYYSDYMQPVVMQWQENDEVTRIYDDMGEMAMQAGLSPCAWLAKFPSADVGGVRQAARALRYALRVVSLCDTLLDLLDEPLKEAVVIMAEAVLPERIQVRV